MIEHIHRVLKVHIHYAGYTRSSRGLHKFMKFWRKAFIMRFTHIHQSEITFDSKNTNFRLQLLGEASFCFSQIRQPHTRDQRPKRKALVLSLRALFFVFWFLAYSGLVYAAGRGKNEKNTLSTRGCSFWVPLNTRGGHTVDSYV